MKLIKGDCIKIMSKLVKQGKKFDAIITDPPYGTTACKWDTVIPLPDMWHLLKQLIKPNGVIVLFGSEPFTSYLIMSGIDWFKYRITWNKVNGIRNHLNARIQPMRIIEDIMVFYKSQPTYNPQMRNGEYTTRKTKNGQSDTFNKVIGIDRGRRVNSLFPHDLVSIKSHTTKDNLHPTQKPVELMKYLVKTYTNKGDKVLDFAMGSGTTGIACKNLKRSFVGIEKDHTYYCIAKGRIDGYSFG